MLNFAVTAFLTVFIIVNPLGNTPVVLAITEEHTIAERKQIVRRASLVMVGVLCLFTLLGQYILDFFHLSIAAIAISGGIILFLIALDMIQAERIKVKTRPEEESEAMAKEDVSVVPLGIPILAGPGSITTVIILASQSESFVQLGIVVAAIFLTGLIAYFVLSKSAFILKLVGRTGVNVGTRLMGLLLCALAVQFVINGIYDIVPDLATKLVPGP